MINTIGGLQSSLENSGLLHVTGFAEN